MKYEFPTSSQIYIEADGKKVAVVQSYEAVTKTSSTPVEAFGESEAVATISGKKTHQITLSRLYATELGVSEKINFHDLEDFSLVIVKPDRRVIYTNCKFTDISEKCGLGDMAVEKVTAISAKRIETV